MAAGDNWNENIIVLRVSHFKARPRLVEWYGLRDEVGGVVHDLGLEVLLLVMLLGEVEEGR